MRKVILVFFISEMDLGTPLHFGRRNEKTPIFSLMTIFHIKLSSGDGLNYRRGLPTNCTYKPAQCLSTCTYLPTYLLTSRPLIHGSGTSPILLNRSGDKSPGETSSKPGPGTSPLVNYRFISPESHTWQRIGTFYEYNDMLMLFCSMLPNS